MPIKEKKYRKLSQLILIVFVPTVIIGGYYYPYLGFIVVALMGCFLILAAFRGRFFCGWFCPMGSFHERVLALFSFKREIPPLFRKSWFRWLVFVVMMTLLTSKLIQAGTNPEKIAGAFRFMWIVAISIAILIGVVFKPRIWCRVCPMGSMQGVMSKNTYLLKVGNDCKECKLCQKVCPISSAPFASKKRGYLSSEECMRCFNCVENCPQKALTFSK
jgi:polyferredoxin